MPAPPGGDHFTCLSPRSRRELSVRHVEVPGFPMPEMLVRSPGA